MFCTWHKGHRISDPEPANATVLEGLRKAATDPPNISKLMGVGCWFLIFEFWFIYLEAFHENTNSPWFLNWCGAKPAGLAIPKCAFP